jgi:hypothetical protein
MKPGQEARPGPAASVDLASEAGFTPAKRGFKSSWGSGAVRRTRARSFPNDATQDAERPLPNMRMPDAAPMPEAALSEAIAKRFAPRCHTADAEARRRRTRPSPPPLPDAALADKAPDTVLAAPGPPTAERSIPGRAVRERRRKSHSVFVHGGRRPISSIDRHVIERDPRRTAEFR